MSEITTRAEEGAKGNPWKLHGGLPAMGGAECLMAIVSKMEAGGAGLSSLPMLAANLRQTADCMFQTAKALAAAESRAASAEAEVDGLRKSLAACMADLERGGLSKRIYSDTVLGAKLEAAEASASALRDRVAVLETALKPFAAVFANGEPVGPVPRGLLDRSLTRLDLRAARAALNGGDHE